MGIPEIESAMDNGSLNESSAVGSKQDSAAATTTDGNTESEPSASRGLGEVKAESEHCGNPSDGHPQSETGDAWVLARTTCNDKGNFKLKMVVGEATISVSQDVLQEAMLLGISLEVDEQNRVYFFRHSRNGGVDPKSMEDEMMDIKKAAKDTGSLGTHGTDRKSEGDATVGRTPSADRESAKDAGNITSRVTESSSGTSGGQAYDTGARLGNNETMMRGTVVCPDESDFRVLGSGGGIERVGSDIVAEALASGISLYLGEKVWLTFSDTGDVVKISNQK